MSIFISFWLFIILFEGVQNLKLPGECNSDLYYDPGSMECQSCPANVSMVTSSDGFGCSCQSHSVPSGVASCRACNATEVVSEDGLSCVRRHCQASSGRIVCRKCPNDFISVTQAFDGSPLKEVLCVKCARGYKAQENKCVKCNACVCNKNEIVVRGICVPKNYVNDRPKYEQSVLHPSIVLEMVKQEYLCTKYDLRACRALARMCVRNFYSTDTAGPCRLWLQPNLISHTGLPQLTLSSTADNKHVEDIHLPLGENKLRIVMAIHTYKGGLIMHTNTGQNISDCFAPLEITISRAVRRDCNMNISNNDMNFNDVYELFLSNNSDFKPVPVSLIKPNGYHVQRGKWPSSKFKKFFILDSALSTTANVTITTYLRSFNIKIKVERDKHRAGSLHLQMSIVLQYATKSPLSDIVTTTLNIEHEMPSTGVLRGLEVWGGVLGTICTLYAVVQWRGVIRRGGLNVALVPLVAGAVADALYFAVLFSTVHALSAEFGTLGITLPLSSTEETVIRSLVYTVMSLKMVKVVWINWCQCRCDIFFIDWSEYNPPVKDSLPYEHSVQWKAVFLAKEWMCMQTKRRASPGFTVTLNLIVLHLTGSWHSYLPNSQGYRWGVAMISWWSAYSTILFVRWIYDKMCGPPTNGLPKICRGIGFSIMVFQEDLYAHYVHGRYDDSMDAKLMGGPLAMCRVVCAPQLRAVYKKLSTPGYGHLGSTEPNRILLTRFLAAFFERALDGLNWVGSERTILERLIDVELTAREGGATSALLYDTNSTTPSCFNVTWWGEEWTLATFDAMLFGCVLLATDQALLAAVTTLMIWQMLKILRTWFGNKNIRDKIEVEI